jgi:hypothetical protein
VTEVPSVAWVHSHLPKGKAQDHFVGRYENWKHLPPASVFRYVHDFNNAAIPRALRRLYSGKAQFHSIIFYQGQNS